MENTTNEAARATLLQLAESLLKYYAVDQPPVPVEEMIKNPPAGLDIDPSQTSVTMEHGLYSYEPRLAMARLLCREISTNAAVKQLLQTQVLLGSYADVKYFARCLLMPSAWMHTLHGQGLSVEQIGEYLQVPSHAVVTRMGELGLLATKTE